jgi:Flp pilus assembly protein TadD
MSSFGTTPPIGPRPQVDRLIAEAAAALRSGQFERAGKTAEAATRLAPTRYEPWMILCTALTRIGSADAEKAMAYAISIFPENDPFRTILEADRAQALAERSRMDEAVAQARIAASRREIAWASSRVIGSALTQAGLFEEALPHAERAYRGLPRDANVNYSLGTVYRFLGRMKEAEEAYNRALACPPDDSLTFIHGALASLRKWSPDSNHVDRLRALAKNASLGPEAVSRIRYALFKELGDLGRDAEAWPELVAAADLARNLFKFDVLEKRAVTDALIRTFPEQRLANPPAAPSPSPQPIFIFGLPRSGTTLVERILAAHSRVTAMGETTGLGRAVKTAARTPGREELNVQTIEASGRADPAEIARLYQQHTAYLSQGADLVTEKLPHNYHYVGHMRVAFPEAPLIHVLRSPMDSLFGAYRLLFAPGAYSWSYALSDLAENYRQYRRLMNHWRDAIGPAFIEVKLETLIADPGREIPRLLDAVGLDFEEACLSPEKTAGGVSTASATQIRSPINREGVGAWRRYAEQLEPLRAELERDGFVDAAGEPIW